MSVKPEIESGGGLLDTLKLIVAFGLVVAGVVGYYWFIDQPAIYRWLGLLGALLLGFGVAYTTRKGKSAWHFITTSRIEVRKMVWPTKQETMQTTFFVLLLVVILGLFMWGLDFFLLWATEKLTGV